MIVGEGVISVDVVEVIFNAGNDSGNNFILNFDANLMEFPLFPFHSIVITIATTVTNAKPVETGFGRDFEFYVDCTVVVWLFDNSIRPLLMSGNKASIDSMS